MEKVISTENRPIKMWLDDIEEGTLSQAKNLANLPFIYKHVALMPDAHHGYGMPIGGVLATKDVIIPNAVGVDIGCGMCAVKTNIVDIDSHNLKVIMSKIRRSIPLGFNQHKEKQDDSLMPEYTDLPTVVSRFYDKAAHQLGTLGGGNHFIEIQRGSDNVIWIMVHSGSRNLGKQVAEYYNKLAKKLNKKWCSEVPEAWDLAFFPISTKEARDYFNEMKYCTQYAFANRKLMINRICESIKSVLGDDIIFEEPINIAHNYAAFEKHFGQDVIVHRKGATRANSGEFGIIPGSQGTNSYIVEGLGNDDSFRSCSHGAGRKLGRRRAVRELDLDTEIKRLNDKGIIHALRGKNDLEEATGAYKDIHEVMNNQTDLVKILVELEPLAVIKG